MKSIFLIIVLFATTVKAGEVIQCRLLHNLEHIEDVRVEVIQGAEKVKIFNHDLIAGYIKSKEFGQYEIEAFLPTHQMRVYAQGSLTNSSASIVLTSWSRELMIDIICKLYAQ